MAAKTKTNRDLWSSAEINLLKYEVEKGKNNSEGIKKAAHALGRSFAATASKFYSLSKQAKFDSSKINPVLKENIYTVNKTTEIPIVIKFNENSTIRIEKTGIFITI